jgi:hypothetical protein
MRRRLLTVFSALSLMLCLATCALWARSYWAEDIILWFLATPPRGQTTVTLVSRRGREVVELTRDQWLNNVQLRDDAHFETRKPTLFRDVDGFFHEMSKTGSTSHFMGFWIHTEHYTAHSGLFRRRSRSATLPDWPPPVLTAILPAAWVLARRRRIERDDAGRCRLCGYDLRATPDRCPECGRMPSGSDGTIPA